jgi:hypothetical protein
MLAILLVTPVFSTTIKGGGLFGIRNIADSSINKYFSSSFLYNLYIGISPVKGLTIGLGKEANYNKDAKIGLYNDNSTLKIKSSIYIFGSYEYKINKFSPYLKFGFYKIETNQTFDNPKLKPFEFNKDKTTYFIGAGIKYNLSKKFNLIADIYTTPCNIEPFEKSVNVGGLRLSGGIEYIFNL